MMQRRWSMTLHGEQILRPVKLTLTLLHHEAKRLTSVGGCCWREVDTDCEKTIEVMFKKRGLIVPWCLSTCSFRVMVLQLVQSKWHDTCSQGFNKSQAQLGKRCMSMFLVLL